MKTRLYILFLNLSALFAGAQISDFQYLGEDYYADELYLNLEVRHVTLTNPAAPRAVQHRLSGYTGDFVMYNSNIEIGTRRYTFRNKLLGELLFVASQDPTDIFRKEETALSHFLVGQHDWAWNFVLTNRVSIAAGVNITDLNTSATYVPVDSTGNLREQDRYTPEPNGWYIGTGPNLFADFLISDFLLLETQFDYTFHLARIVNLRYGAEEDGYPLPQVFYTSVNLLTKWGFYVGSDYTHLINRGETPFNPRKFEVHFGFKIMI